MAKLKQSVRDKLKAEREAITQTTTVNTAALQQTNAKTQGPKLKQSVRDKLKAERAAISNTAASKTAAPQKSALQKWAERQTASEAAMGNPDKVTGTAAISEPDAAYQQRINAAVQKAVTMPQKQSFARYAKEAELTRRYANARTAEEQQIAKDALVELQSYLPGGHNVMSRISGAVGGGIVGLEAGVAKAVNPLARGGMADRALENLAMENTRNKAGMGAVGGFAYDAAQTLTNNAAALALGATTGGAVNPLLTMGVSAGGQSVHEAQKAGASDRQAVTAGIVNGVMEAAFEKIPLDNLFRIAGKDLTGKVIQTQAESALKAVARQAGYEGLSEGMTSLAQDIANAAIYERDTNPDFSIEQWTKDTLKDVGYSMLLGGVVGGGMGAPAAWMGTRARNEALQQAQAAGAEQTPAGTPNGQQEANLTAEEDTHTPEQRQVIEDYNNAVDNSLLGFVQKVINKAEDIPKRFSLKAVSERQAADIKRLTGVDTTGFVTAIERRAVEHIDKNHGANGRTDHSMSDIKDIARVQYVLDNYDDVEHGGRAKSYTTVENGHAKTAQTVVFSKKIDGHYYVVEAVPDTKAKTTYIVSAYKSRSTQPVGANQQNADASTIRPDTQLADAPANTSIPNAAGNSNILGENNLPENASMIPATPAEMQRHNISRVASFAKTLGKAGQTVFTSMYDGTQPADVYVGGMMKAYNAGQQGRKLPAAGFAGLTPPQVRAAHLAGLADASGEAAQRQPKADEKAPAEQQNGLKADGQTAEPAGETAKTPQQIQGAVMQQGGEAVDQRREPAKRQPKATAGYTAAQNAYVKAIEEWNGKDDGGYFRLGKTPAYLSEIGIPGVSLYFDKSKAVAALQKHSELSKKILSQIPKVLNDAIVIAESYDNTALLFGELYDDNQHPIMVALRVRSTVRGNSVEIVNKIRSIEARSRDFDKLLADDKIVYLCPDKKRTDTWFQALGRSTPVGGTKYGSIRMLSFSEDIVKDNSKADQRRGERNADHSAEWQAERVGNMDKKPMRLSDIIEKIRHDFGLNITTGYIRDKGVRGQYNVQAQGIRARIANDLPVIAHELGHYFERTYGMTNDIGKEIEQELLNQMPDEFRESYSERQQSREGVAEYVRKLMQNRETAAIDYPLFTDYFKKKLSGRDLALLNSLADEVNAYYAQGASTASDSIRLREEGAPDARTDWEKICDMGDDIYQAWIDSNHGIKLFDAAVGSDVYKLATNSAYSDAIAWQIITGDLTDRNGVYVAPGLKTALHGINTRDTKEYKAFGEYLIMRHGVEYLADGYRVFADDRKNSTKWMNARRQELEQEYPKFAAAAERLYQFLANFHQTWGVETGLLDAEILAKWQETNPDYVPFNRAIPKRTGAKRGFGNQTSPIKRRQGSGLDIIHPVDNIIDQIVLMVNTGVRNNVMLALRNAALKAENKKIAAFMENVSMPLRPNAASGLDATAKSEAEQVIDELGEVYLQFQRANAQNDVVTVLINGKPEYWKINDKLLLESVTAMTPPQREGILEAYATTTRFITGNITGNNVIWSFFSNFPRDIQTLMVYTQNGSRMKALKAIGSSYLNALEKLAGMDVDPLYREYLALGGGHTSAYSADTNLAKRARRKLTPATKAQRVRAAVNPINWLSPLISWVEFISNLIEQGPRFATYKVMRNAGLNPQEAFYEAMDVTTNFRRGGRLSREMNKLFPFFNASVQGINKFTRYFTAEDAKGRGVKVRYKVIAGRWMFLVAVSATTAALSTVLNLRDDDRKDDYNQLSNYTKNAYHCIPLGDGRFFTVPKPRELAVLTSLMEVCIERYATGNTHAFDEFYKYASDNFFPSGISDLVQLPEDIARDGLQEGLINAAAGVTGSMGLAGVITNQIANRDFLGKPIVSAAVEDMEPKDQFNSSTSKMAHWLGQALNLSPARIDYFAKNVLGVWWKVPSALFPYSGESDLSMGVKSTYIKDNVYSQDLVNWLYDRADKTGRAANSNPDDMQKIITAKQDATMVSFYGKFNRLNRGNAVTEVQRHTRQTVLDMLIEYRKYCESGVDTRAQNAVYALVRQTGSTEYMPSVMNTYVKDGNEIRHDLTDTQYVTYQTRYLADYWDYVEQTLNVNASRREQEAVMKAAKEAAKESATNEILKQVGAAPTKYASKYSSVNADDVIEFRAQLDMANDADGSVNQQEAIAILQDMVNGGLDGEDAYTLFHSRWPKSDKNNPWRFYAN